MPETDLVKSDNAKPGGQRRDYGIPNCGIVGQAVDQNQWSSVARLDVVNLYAVNRDKLIRRWWRFLLLLRWRARLK